MTRNAHACVGVCTYNHRYMHIYIYICIYIYTHINIVVHTCTHTDRGRCAFRKMHADIHKTACQPSVHVIIRTHIAQTDRDRRTDRQTDRQADRQTERLREADTERERERETERERERQRNTDVKAGLCLRVSVRAPT